MSSSPSALAARVARFDPAVLEETRDHLLSGMAAQDNAFLEQCARVGVDPRTSVRLAFAADGTVIATAAREDCLHAVLRGVRLAPKRITIDFSEAPIFGAAELPPPSQSSK